MLDVYAPGGEVTGPEALEDANTCPRCGGYLPPRHDGGEAIGTWALCFCTEGDDDP